MLRCLAIGIAAFGAAALLSDRIEPGPGDPVPLRWLRVLAEHPVRGSLGLALLAGSMLPRRALVGGARSAGAPLDKDLRKR